MPFKTFGAPRKLSSVDGELVAAAFIGNPGLVVFLSAHPVRLATFSISGSPGKVTNVALDGADAVALLSRDTAVVRGTDDSVWALLDITHTPKVEQVARDVRSLAFRPGGDTALTLGWDGSASELKLSKIEVEARGFALRGGIRAVDVGDTETYVLTEDAGQLRVHPGATPEPGASLRANLPREASELDRVRGNPRLIAAYKAGTRRVALATGGPAKLVAKVVELEAEVAALGVAETSLVAAFNDGRLALYDSDAISAAGEGGPIAPKYVTTLGARGKPTSLLITNKGSFNVWIGTSAGEVWSASLVRKGAI